MVVQKSRPYPPVDKVSKKIFPKLLRCGAYLDLVSQPGVEDDVVGDPEWVEGPGHPHCAGQCRDIAVVWGYLRVRGCRAASPSGAP